MTTSSWKMRIEKFDGRRGTPSVIRFFNNTNFQSWKTQAPPVLTKLGIKRKFTPPAAPHHGCLWEHPVRRYKRVFYAIIVSRKLTPEVLETTFCLVEQSITNRPITSVSAKPDSSEVLTPPQFLFGRNGTSFSSLHEHFDHRRQYIRAQSYANEIWSRSF